MVKITWWCSNTHLLPNNGTQIFCTKTTLLLHYVKGSTWYVIVQQKDC